jgi:hypothetical protein
MRGPNFTSSPFRADSTSQATLTSLYVTPSGLDTMAMNCTRPVPDVPSKFLMLT